MRELVMQMCVTDVFAKELLQEPATPILDIDRAVSRASRSQLFPKAEFGHPLAGSLLPWIHKDLGDGQSREEWKGMAEGNRILGLESKPIPIDGLCVRIGSMRCHSQALTVKLTRNVSLAAIERMIGDAHPWVRVIPN